MDPFFFAGLVLTLSACSSLVPTVPPPPTHGSVQESSWNSKLIYEAQSAYTLGQRGKAALLFETAFALEDPESVVWLKHLLFYCYLSTGQADRALKLAQTNLRAQPHESISYLHLGLAELWTGQHPRAVQSFLRSLDFENHSPMASFYLGLAREKAGDMQGREEAFTNVEKELKQILQSNPNDFEANYSLATVYLHWDREIERAEQNLQICLSMANGTQTSVSGPQDAAPLDLDVYRHFYLARLQGILQFRKKNYTQAVDLSLETSTHAWAAAFPHLAEIHHYLARSYQELGDKIKAERLFASSKALDPLGPYSQLNEEAIRSMAYQHPAL